MGDVDWFKVGDASGRTILINQESGRQELRFHHLVHRVERTGLDITISDTEGAVLIQRILKSDTSAGSVDEKNEDPQEVKQAMSEMDQFMRCFSMISEIIETPEIGIHLKFPEDESRRCMPLPRKRHHRHNRRHRGFERGYFNISSR